MIENLESNFQIKFDYDSLQIEEKINQWNQIQQLYNVQCYIDSDNVFDIKYKDLIVNLLQLQQNDQNFINSKIQQISNNYSQNLTIFLQDYYKNILLNYSEKDKQIIIKQWMQVLIDIINYKYNNQQTTIPQQVHLTNTAQDIALKYSQVYPVQQLMLTNQIPYYQQVNYNNQQIFDQKNQYETTNNKKQQKSKTKKNYTTSDITDDNSLSENIQETKSKRSKLQRQYTTNKNNDIEFKLDEEVVDIIRKMKNNNYTSQFVPLSHDSYLKTLDLSISDSDDIQNIYNESQRINQLFQKEFKK